jgi:hypothetical protein
VSRGQRGGTPTAVSLSLRGLNKGIIYYMRHSVIKNKKSKAIPVTDRGGYRVVRH